MLTVGPVIGINTIYRRRHIIDPWNAGPVAPRMDHETDSDPAETQEWLDALAGTAAQAGRTAPHFCCGG